MQADIIRSMNHKNKDKSEGSKNVAEYSPMMQHYLQTKEEYKDCILFYRLGDFYEMFFDDAKIVAKGEALKAYLDSEC